MRIQYRLNARVGLRMTPLAAVLLLVGCAVMTIDVDVYKGPLSNEREVQVKELAAIAVGYRPILVMFRDRLEWPNPDVRKTMQQQKWYRAGVIVDEPVTQPCDYAYRFKDDHAREINGVLGLYRPVIQGPLANELADIESAAVELRNTIYTYQDILVSHDSPLAQMVQGAASQPYSDIINSNSPTLQTDIPQPIDLQHINYYKFLYYVGPNSRATTQPALQQVRDFLRKPLADEATAAQSLYFDAINLLQDVNWDPGMSAVYPDKILIRDQCAALIASMTDTRAFYLAVYRGRNDADPAFKDIWAELNRASYGHKEPTTREVPLADAHSIIFQLLTKDEPPPQVPVTEGISAECCRVLESAYDYYSDSAKASETRTGPFQIQLNDATDLFCPQPSDDIPFWKKWQNWWPKESIPYPKPPHYITYWQRWENYWYEHGIAPSLLIDTTNFNFRYLALDSLTRTITTISESTNSGFETGREQKGLDDLIDDFLQAAPQAVTEPASETNLPGAATTRRDYAESKLLAALVYFGEKIRVLGNNIIMVDVVPDNLNFPPPRNESKEVAQRKTLVKMYAPILQSMGNTITVEVNELQHWNSVEQQQRQTTQQMIEAFALGLSLANSTPYTTSITTDTAQTAPDTPAANRRASVDATQPAATASGQIGHQPQVPALSSALPMDPTLMNFFRSLNQHGSAMQSVNTSKDVLDLWLNSLQVAYQNEVRSHGSETETARHLAEAIQKADQFRTDFIYIRPASAYLRDSYPASILQKDPGIGWNNLLLDEGIRSLPFVGTGWANMNDQEMGDDPLYIDPLSQDALRRRRVASEVDRQFWQNVNSIRVSAPGLSNFAIVQDDIGNWYVKDMGTDTSQITSTAMNLFLFNAAGSVANTALISKLQHNISQTLTTSIPASKNSAAVTKTQAIPQGLSPDDVKSTTSQSDTVRSEQYANAANLFADTSRDDYKRVQSALCDIEKEVNAATQPSSGDGTSKQTDVQASLQKVLIDTADFQSLMRNAATRPAADVANDDLGDAIDDALISMRHYSLNLKLIAATKPSMASDATMTKIQSDLLSKLRELVRKRIEHVDIYQGEVEVISK